MIKTKNDIIEVGRRCWIKDFVASNDGNISVKANNRIFATATGISKGFMKPADIVELDTTGKIISRVGKPSSEIKMHLEVYNQRPDINAVVHAHPTYATAFALAGIELSDCVMPELLLTVGTVPIAPYGTPSTSEIPNSITDYIKQHDVILLANHGILCAGTDVFNAYYKLETTEHYCKMLYISYTLGNINYLDTKKVTELDMVRKKLGLSPHTIQCKVPDDRLNGLDIKYIVEKVLKKMNGS